ncbi:hypothetical protein B0A49_13510, partial [Cryomyces minteri]
LSMLPPAERLARSKASAISRLRRSKRQYESVSPVSTASSPHKSLDNSGRGVSRYLRAASSSTLYFKEGFRRVASARFSEST